MPTFRRPWKPDAVGITGDLTNRNGVTSPTNHGFFRDFGGRFMAKLAFFVLLKTMVKKDKKGGYKCSSPWAMGAWIR